MSKNDAQIPSFRSSDIWSVPYHLIVHVNRVLPPGLLRSFFYQIRSFDWFVRLSGIRYRNRNRLRIIVKYRMESQKKKRILIIPIFCSSSGFPPMLGRLEQIDGIVTSQNEIQKIDNRTERNYENNCVVPILLLQLTASAVYPS